MNIQTERLENHKARLTVEVDVEQLDKAKQAAARKIAKRVNIPGFRKGKAPYRLLVNYVGEATILEDAMEILGNDVYKSALDEADIDPYGPGELEDFKIDPTPTFIFTVPLQPVIELGDYRSVRLDYEAPVVDDAMVDRALKMMQEQEALVEESSRPVEMGNRVTADIHSFFVEDTPAEAPEADASEADSSDITTEDDEHDLHAHDESEIFIHEHDAQIRLSESEDDEPVLPGFSAALVGANVNETREFELTIPENSKDYDEEIAGKRVKFHVTVKKVETMTLPELNDDLAARITESEDEPLTLLQLRMRVRENLEKESEQRAKSNYSSRVLNEIVEQAQIAYPEALINEQIETFLKDLDRRMRQEGLTLEDYLKVTGKSHDDLAADYHEPAITTIERQLTMLELLNAEKIRVTEDDINQKLDEMIASFGEQHSASLRPVFDTPQMRSNILNDLLQQKLYDRLADIAMGKSLEETEPTDTPDAEAQEPAAAPTSASTVDAPENSNADEIVPDNNLSS